MCVLFCFFFECSAPPPPPATRPAAAARKAFPGVTLGGGMLSYFTELNRKPAPRGVFDFITHTACPIVHAADDLSVMETLDEAGRVAGSHGGVQLSAAVEQNRARARSLAAVPSRRRDDQEGEC